jgi:ribokinase
MLDIIGLGSIFVDYFFETEVAHLKKVGLGIEEDCLWEDKFKENQKLFLRGLKLKTKSLGGMTVNTIMVLSKMGLKCGTLGMIGNDTDGNFARNQIKGINIDEVIEGGNTAKCFCLITNKGQERTFVVYENKKEDDVFNKINMDYINESKFIHLSPFFTQNMKLTFEKVKKLVDRIEGPKITFTPSATYVGYGLDKLKPILKKIHVYFSNKWEMEVLSKSNDLFYESKKLLEYGPKIVICTLGSEGVLVTTPDKQFQQAAIKPKKIIDSTGAGDTFAGGFLYGLIKNKTIEESTYIGTKLASMSLSEYGEGWLKDLINTLD